MVQQTAAKQQTATTGAPPSAFQKQYVVRGTKDHRSTRISGPKAQHKRDTRNHVLQDPYLYVVCWAPTMTAAEVRWLKSLRIAPGCALTRPRFIAGALQGPYQYLIWVAV